MTAIVSDFLSRNKQLLLNNIRAYVNLSDADAELIFAACHGRSFKRGEFITYKGEISKYTHFIAGGSARVYYIDPNGHEHNVQLGISNWWLGDYSSFISQQPGLLFTEALESTEIICFSYEELNRLYDQVPPLERFFRLLIQKAYASFQQRLLLNLSLDAEQRYLSFREKYPDLDRNISQKHIASYLGMSAEFLSKVKKRLAEKERRKM